MALATTLDRSDSKYLNYSRPSGTRHAHTLSSLLSWHEFFTTESLQLQLLTFGHSDLQRKASNDRIRRYASVCEACQSLHRGGVAANLNCNADVVFVVDRMCRSPIRCF